MPKLYSQAKEVKDLIDLYIESRYPTDVALLEGGLLPSIEKARAYLDFAKIVSNDILKGG
ncbi:MAG: hypothetical protein LBB36_03275 [Fibromonadaceae bacterium]|nr:hypothetical protein [Fibromonadaceae bacterium]